MAMLLAPAAALMAAMAAPLLALIRVGQLDAQGSELVAAVLASFMTGLLGYSCFFLLTRASYAIDDVRSPTTVFLGVTAAAIVGMAVTSSLVDGDAEVIVLGLANGVAVSLGSAALYRRLRRHVDRPMPILATSPRSRGDGGRWRARVVGGDRHRVGRARGGVRGPGGGRHGRARRVRHVLLALREPEVLALRGRIGPRG